MSELFQQQPAVNKQLFILIQMISNKKQLFLV